MKKKNIDRALFGGLAVVTIAAIGLLMYLRTTYEEEPQGYTLTTPMQTTVTETTTAEVQGAFMLTSDEDIGGAHTVAVYGNGHALLGASNHIYVLDASDPSNIRELDSLDLCNVQVITLDMKRLLAYVACSRVREGFGQGFAVVDISDPSNLEVLGMYIQKQNIANMELQGNILHLANYHLGYTMVDVTDPENPTLVGNIPIDEFEAQYFERFPEKRDTPNLRLRIEDLAVNGDITYVAAAYGEVFTLDTSDPSNIRITDWDKNGDNPLHEVRSLRIAGNRLFAGTPVAPPPGREPEFGMHVYDISIPDKPILVSHTEDLLYWYVASHEYGSQRLITSDFKNGLRVINVADPQSPEVILAMNPGGDEYRRLDVLNDTVYMTSQKGNGLYIINLETVTRIARR